MYTTSENALDKKARRAAHKAGYVARKSRRRQDSIDNLGGFMLVDPQLNCVVAGARFDLSAEDAIDWCQKAE